jgi:mono/diheme cytochrome c family protein
LYNINCTPCHAEDGKGKGTIVADGKFPSGSCISADRLPTINPGKAFYSITHGKNLMGAYGTVLTPTQRWQVIHYIYQLGGGALLRLLRLIQQKLTNTHYLKNYN